MVRTVALGRNRLRKPAVKLRHILIVVSIVILHWLYALYSFASSSSLGDSSPATKPQEYYSLPKWISDYVEWHAEMRTKFPGKKLFTDPNAPPILIRTCLGLCGGLNDRIGQLPWDLYIANQTGRVLLLHWHRPVPLENFLVPNGRIDWTVPRDVEGFFSERDVRVSREGMKKVRAYPELFEGYASENPEDDFWKEHFDLAIQRATQGTFKDKKVLRHRLLGHINEEELESRLRSLGETDMLHWTRSFGTIFHLFFKPSTGVQKELDTAYKSLDMKPGRYSAVHCRVRHPKAFPRSMTVKGSNEKYPADKSGLPWKGETRQWAIETATHALSCAKRLVQSAQEQVYFFSDSNDLVRFVSHELTDSKYVATHDSELHTNPVDSAALKAVSELNVVARDMAVENAHIDRQKGRDPPAYYATFVDLFLGVNARCVTYGVGYYAVLATKISGTKCKLLYQEETWGGIENKRANTDLCMRE